MTTHVDDRPPRRFGRNPQPKQRPTSDIYEAAHALGRLLVEFDDEDPYVAGHAARRVIRGLLTGARSAAGVRARAHDAAAPVMRAMNALILAATDAGRTHVSECAAVAAARAAGGDAARHARERYPRMWDHAQEDHEHNARHAWDDWDDAEVEQELKPAPWWKAGEDEAEGRARAMNRALSDHPDLADLLRRASDALGVFAYHHVNHPDPQNNYPDVGDAIGIMGEIEQIAPPQ